METNTAEELTNSEQYVTFLLGDELFGVQVTRAREILNLAPLTQVPQTPEYMLGVINLRGQVVPVIDMRIKLNIPAGEQTQNTCIIVVEIQVDDDEVQPAGTEGGVRVAVGSRVIGAAVIGATAVA